jgi:hypothetical protein
LREIAFGPPLFRTTSFGDEIEIYRTRYDVLEAAPRAFLPRTIAAVAAREEVDRLNVCDPADEAGHGYRFDSQLGNLRLHGTARVDVYPGADHKMADSGRAIVGTESFEVNAVPGNDLLIAMRTAQVVEVNILRPGGGRAEPLQFVEAEVQVRVDGQPAAQGRFRPGEGWDEMLILVPAAAITRHRPRIEISGRYAAYRYWFYQ